MFTAIGCSFYTLGRDISDLELRDFSHASTAAMNSIPYIKPSDIPPDAGSVTKVKSVIGRLFASLMVVGVVALSLKAVVVLTTTLFLAVLAHDIYVYNEECAEALKAQQEGRNYGNEIYHKMTKKDSGLLFTETEQKRVQLEEEEKRHITVPFKLSIPFTESQKELLKRDITYAKLHTTWIARELYYAYAWLTNIGNNVYPSIEETELEMM